MDLHWRDLPLIWPSLFYVQLLLWAGTGINTHDCDIHHASGTGLARKQERCIAPNTGEFRLPRSPAGVH
jgi:hypothetical protein